MDIAKHEYIIVKKRTKSKKKTKSEIILKQILNSAVKACVACFEYLRYICMAGCSSKNLSPLFSVIVLEASKYKQTRPCFHYFSNASCSVQNKKRVFPGWTKVIKISISMRSAYSYFLRAATIF